MASEMKKMEISCEKDNQKISSTNAFIVPALFCDSVVCLTAVSYAPEFQKLQGYWSVAGSKASNHHIICSLDINPIDGDRWEYALGIYGDYTPIPNWKELLAEKRCLVIRAVMVKSERHFDTTYESISTQELKNLMLSGYQTPLEFCGTYPDSDFFTPEDRIRIVHLLEDFNVSSITLDCEPEYEDYLVKVFDSRHLVQATVGGLMPDSLHSHVHEWGRRNECDKIVIEDSTFCLDFSVFENILQRIERKEYVSRFDSALEGYFSEEDCQRIQAMLEARSNWINLGEQQNPRIGRQTWGRVDMHTARVNLDKAGYCQING